MRLVSRQRGARGSEVIQDEGSFIHLRQQVGAETAIAEVARDDKHSTDRHQGEGALKRPLQRTLVIVEQALEGASTLSAKRLQESRFVLFSASYAAPGDSSSPAGARARE